MLSRLIVTGALFIWTCLSGYAQEEIRLWEGKAPGSENWIHQEADFLVSLYGPSQVDVNVPANAPPLFVAVAANHKPVSMGCVALYTVWNEAGKPAELHVYSKGSGGFGMGGKGLPSDTWPDRFLEWLKAEGF